ncbi:hypothetical protein DNTS_014549 [Danionella cerebrum]|uniref:U-box domain-containing protein n=1 Tax=Danionella cerebrum TaxID=2873325 RepID=A0A553RLU5_9TELE|nr:hypothetical protein DNTS_014549 [Danionella translucida]
MNVYLFSAADVLIMVLNMCLAHFETSIHCNKLCADGYDVSNLLSEDPNVRRRGFKLEYFLRPPVHVTLSFQLQIELYRLDLELWPWAMDSGSRRIEVSTNSVKDNHNLQLVSRCDLKDELQVCLVHPTFKPRAPFCEALPQTPAHAREFWKRGSLGSIAQLQISIVYSGAAASVGFKSISVWGLPSRSCSASEVELIHRAQLNARKSNSEYCISAELDPLTSRIQGDLDTKYGSKRKYESSFPSTSSAPEGLPWKHSRTDPNPQSLSSTGSDPNETPEEFLDPLTQELMVLPMILPSGMIIDQSTLEEYEKREATWGRVPNDPFTGVPFSQSSKPLPNPLLKSRIDRLVLRMGCTGVGSRTSAPNKPQPSRLVLEPKTDKIPEDLKVPFRIQSDQGPKPESNAHHSSSRADTEQFPSRNNQQTCWNRKMDPNSSRSSFEMLKKLKQEQSRFQCESTSKTGDKRNNESGLTSPGLSLPREANSIQTESICHERRLAESLDAALDAALNGLPVFTSPNKTENSSKGGLSCVFCSCSLSVFSSGVPSYSLPCDCKHVVCGECVRQRRTPESGRTKLQCPSCGSPASSKDITRVHH